jgi:hypothetical protein
MGATAAAVEVPGGKMSDLVADHLAEDRDWRQTKLGGEPNHAALEVDAPQRAAKPAAPFDPYALGKALEPPPRPAASQQVLDGCFEGSAGGGLHAQDASTAWDDRSRGSEPPTRTR